MEIFSRVRRGVSPDINALATIMVLIVATGVVASTVWMKRQERKRLLEEQMARSDAG
jgi:putrescine transport system permease protein